MKKVISIIIVLMISFLITGCVKEKTDAVKFKEEYENLNNKKYTI